jgi:hypothetical protein
MRNNPGRIGRPEERRKIRSPSQGIASATGQPLVLMAAADSPRVGYALLSTSLDVPWRMSAAISLKIVFICAASGWL